MAQRQRNHSFIHQLAPLETDENLTRVLDHPGYALLADDEDELGDQLLHLRHGRRHQADELVAQEAPLLRQLGEVPRRFSFQRRKNGHFQVSAGVENRA